MSDFSLNRDHTIYQEMMAHPVLFSHVCPLKVAVVGDGNSGILQEILKHTSITEAWEITKDNQGPSLSDERLHYQHNNNEWIATVSRDSFDIFIITETTQPELFGHYFNALKSDGILLQLCGSAFEVQDLKSIKAMLMAAKFKDTLTLSYPQPNYPTGWRASLLAKKSGVFKKIREKDIYNKTFSTRYYNFDVHKGALVMPEFMRTELMI